MKKFFILFAAAWMTVSLSAATIYCKMTQGWWTVDGAAVGIYYWGTSSDPAWPGYRMTSVGNGIWSYDLPAGVSTVIFSRVNGSGAVAAWGAQTKDLDVPTDGKNLFTITTSSPTWGGNPGCDGEWSVYDGTSGGDTPGGDTPGGDTPGGDCQESYGLMIDGVYHAGTKNDSPLDDSFIEYSVLGVQLTAGQYVKVHSLCADASWVISKYAKTSYEFAVENGAYKVSETGTYDFYLKFKYEADEIYISCAGCQETPGGGGDTPGGGGDCEEFGLLIDGVYQAGSKNPTPGDPSFNEYMLLGVQLTAGQKLQVHDKCNDGTWIITKYAQDSYEFAIEDGAYKVSETGKYDFYFKFKYQADEIYISCAGCKETPVSSGSVPRQCEDVMIQAFYNESYWPDSAELGTDLYGDTKWATLLPQAEEMAKSFDLIWLPPSAYGDGMGYHPKQYSNQNSNWGTREELEALIAAFHANGAKVVADIVINHCAGWSTWCDFPEMDFGEYGVFHPDASYICSNDEVNAEWNKPTEENPGSGECWGTATGSPDDGDNWSGARDWSHDKVYVQEMFIAYLKWMRNVMKYDGFRYDKGDGFNNWHHWNYNDKAKPYIAFMESYNGTDEIQREINQANGDLMGLDFDLKWHVFNAIAGWDYSHGRGDCIMSRGDGRHAVTFMESHDWFLRPDNENEFCGRGNSMKPEIKARLMQCNAMLLSLPGVPCIFYPHWAKYKEDLKPMIFARKAAGVHSESPTNDEEASATGYKITTVGKRGNLILMLGDKVQGDNPASWLPENHYYKMASNYSTMDGHNESFEIWVSMFDGSDPRDYDPSKPVDPTPGPDPEPTPIEPDPNYRNSAPENCTDVMIQAFYWDSYEKKQTGSKTEVYGDTKWTKFTSTRTKAEEYEPGSTKKLFLGEEIGRWFDLVWLPPFSRSTGGTGYLPIQYSSLESAWGTEIQLRKLIGMLHSSGAKVIEDIVINHASGEPTWCTFAEQDFGDYGVYQPTAKWICNTDDLNWSEEAQEEAGDCFKKASGNADAGYDGLDDFKGGRDWDHKNVNVQNMCKSYLKWLINDVYVDGFRYDYVKGFKNGYIADYNAVASPYFTVMEAWSGDVGNLQYHLNEARRKSMTFDFATKFTAFNDGLTNNNYSKLKGSGLLGAGESRYAVTFIDNHDTFLRKDDNGWSNEFMGYEQSMANEANQAKVLQANAFILSMPGVPCVFYPHWFVFKEQLKPMINARYKTGVHSQSSVSDEAGQDYYKATIYGTNGEIRLLLGPASGYDTTPAGYTLAVKGTNFGVYYRTNEARNDKITDRTPITTAVENVENNTLQVEKFIHNGQLYIRLGDKIYDMMGRKIQ